MVASEKRGYALVAVGFAFLGVGFAFLASDNSGIGVSLLATAVILLLAGSTIIRRRKT